MSIRISIAFWSFLAAIVTGVLVPVAYFGDKNEPAAKWLSIIASTAACVFLIAVFWR